jgi:hypothetical protein
MDEIKEEVIHLLINGWTSLEAIQKELELSDETMGEILEWLIDEEYIITHTIH